MSSNADLTIGIGATDIKATLDPTAGTATITGQLQYPDGSSPPMSPLVVPIPKFELFGSIVAALGINGWLKHTAPGSTTIDDRDIARFIALITTVLNYPQQPGSPTPPTTISADDATC